VNGGKGRRLSELFCAVMCTIVVHSHMQLVITGELRRVDFDSGLVFVVFSVRIFSARASLFLVAIKFLSVPTQLTA